jgi:hypothetical protein
MDRFRIGQRVKVRAANRGPRIQGMEGIVSGIYEVRGDDYGLGPIYDVRWLRPRPDIVNPCGLFRDELVPITDRGAEAFVAFMKALCTSQPTCIENHEN